MSVFNTAIQTLSEIAIQEAGVTIPEVTRTSLLEEVKNTMDNFPTLSLDECRFDAMMVPIRENRRLGKYLIEMEDLSRYMITNQISSITEAVGDILTANDLVGQYSNIALVVDEASILDEMDQLGANISGDYPTPTPGLGNTIFGSQDNFKNLRRIANTKELLDTLYNKYGLPIVKKNYSQVGLLKENEDTKVNLKPDQTVLTEKKPNQSSPSGSATPSSTSAPDSSKGSATSGLVEDYEFLDESAQSDPHDIEVNRIKSLLSW